MAVYGKALARPSPFLSPIPAPIVAGRRLISMRGDTRCSVRAETEMWESQSCHRFRDFFQKRVAVDRFDFRGRIRERGKVARDGAERRVTAYHIFRQEIHKGQIADIAIIGNLTIIIEIISFQRIGHLKLIVKSLYELFLLYQIFCGNTDAKLGPSWP